MLPNSSQTYTLLVGTYNSKVIALRFAPPSSLSILHTTDLSVEPWTDANPSWIEKLPKSSSKLLVADESDDGKVLIAHIKDGGKLEFVDAHSSEGGAPSYIGSTKDGKWAFGVNVIKFPGSSVNKDRQEMSHPHHLQEHPTTGTVFIPDLGTDQIHELALSSDGVWEVIGSTKVDAGAGPRHMRFTADGKTAYLVTEMGNALVVYDVETINGAATKLNQRSTHSIVPPGAEGGKMGGGEILLSKDEKTIFVSNRNEGNPSGDAIAVFSLPPSEPTFYRSGGQHIRGMELDPTGKYLAVGNMNSAEVAIFEFSKGAAEELKPTARLQFEEGIKATAFVWV
ncbi:3-carboxy-cis,cis-mucoante lactonizing enzyme [Atractiella rhizophila]|nr:3-carboxy-cis,cis-mucoante lactonizing enzyme [Atractiella rhizophila]